MQSSGMFQSSSGDDGDDEEEEAKCLARMVGDVVLRKREKSLTAGVEGGAAKTREASRSMVTGVEAVEPRGTLGAVGEDMFTVNG